MFIDLQSLSGFTAAVYILVIIGFFAIIFYVLINKIMAKPVDFNKQKRADKQQKKVSSKTKGFWWSNQASFPQEGQDNQEDRPSSRVQGMQGKEAASY